MDNISILSPLDKIILVRNCSGLTAVQKSILYSLVSRLGINGFCYPSFSILMKDTGLNNRTSLSDNLKSLIENKFITIISPDKHFKSNRYKINFDELIRKAYQSKKIVSTEAVPDQYGSRTNLVREPYPKRKETEIKNKIVQPKNWKGLSKSGEKVSPLLEEFIKSTG